MNFLRRFKGRRKPPENLTAALTRIEGASVERNPFPHIVIREALPAAEFQRIQRNWPDRNNMWHEKSHDRYWAYYEGAAGVPKNVWLDPEWTAIKEELIDPMFAAIAARLRPWYKARYAGEPALEARLLALHEAGPDFVEHKAHTHFVHNPGYAFTVIYCVDDAGFACRGTTLYGFPDAGSETESSAEISLMNKASGGLLHLMIPKVVIPFQPNRLLAFVDGPSSIHGSTPFDTSLVLPGMRRMILSHVTEHTIEAGTDPAFWLEQFRRYRDERVIAPQMRELLQAELGVLKSWKNGGRESS
jgi:hypothetical protein